MYYFLFEGVPTPKSPDFGAANGAYINCWIEHSTLSQAEASARQQIQEAGWEIKLLEESRIVDRSDYADNPTSLQYFEQAESDGGVMVFYEYPDK